MNMGEIVFLSPNNAKLVLCIPLYTRQVMHTGKYKFLIGIENDKPIAYAIDGGEKCVHCLRADFVEKQLINLGAL